MNKKNKKQKKSEQVINESVVQQSKIENEYQPQVTFKAEIIRGVIAFLKYSEIISLRLLNQKLNVLVMNELMILKTAPQKTTEDQLNTLLTKFSNIQHINFPHLFENELTINIPNKEQIKTMNFKYTQFKEEYLNGFISEFKRIKNLGVMQDSFLNLLRPQQVLENIESLDAYHIYKIQPKVFELFPNLKKLKLSINCYNHFFSTLPNNIEKYNDLTVLSIRLWGNKLQDKEFELFMEFLSQLSKLKTLEISLNIYKLGVQRAKIIQKILSLKTVSELILYGLTIQEVNSLQFTKLYDKIVIGHCSNRSTRQAEDEEDEDEDSDQDQDEQNSDLETNLAEADEHILTSTLKNISQFTKELDITNIESYQMFSSKDQANNNQCKIRISRKNNSNSAPLRDCLISDKFNLQFY